MHNSPAPQAQTDNPASMHDNVQTWDDLCSCEPEARWAAVADAPTHGDTPQNQSIQ